MRYGTHRHAMGTNIGVVSAILSNRSRNKMVVFVQLIQNVSKLWNRWGSQRKEKTLILMEYYRINGVDLAESQIECNSYLATYFSRCSTVSYSYLSQQR